MPTKIDDPDRQRLAGELVASIIDSCVDFFSERGMEIDDNIMLNAFAHILAFGLIDSGLTDAEAMQKVVDIMPAIIKYERDTSDSLPPDGYPRHSGRLQS